MPRARRFSGLSLALFGSPLRTAIGTNWAQAPLSRKKAALVNKKKYQAKVGPRPTKVVYDDDGVVRLRARTVAGAGPSITACSPMHGFTAVCCAWAGTRLLRV